MKKILVKLIAIIMLFTLAMSFAGCGVFQSSNNEPNNNTPSIQVYNRAEFGTITENRTAKNNVQVIKEVKNSVVAIAIANSAGTSYGSGVIVDMNVTDEGGRVLDASNEFYVLTCHHVISGMGNITVYVPDAESDNFGEEDYNDKYAFTGEIDSSISNNAVTLVGGDKDSDVAVLKLAVSDSGVASTIKKAKFPASDYVMEQGESVVAIGNPTGTLPGTATTGTIAYINRETTVGEVGAMTLIQLNVDIYHGSSGGGLFNMYGELIGLTNAGSDENSGINYAIPFVIDANNGTNDYGFKNVAGQLLSTKTNNNYGYVAGRKALFGFTTTTKTYANSTSTYVLITDVTVGSIAYNKGIKANDILVKVVKGDASKLASASQVSTNVDVTDVFNSLYAGDSVSLLLKRQKLNSYDYEDVTVTMTAAQFIFCNTGNNG